MESQNQLHRSTAELTKLFFALGLSLSLFSVHQDGEDTVAWHFAGKEIFGKEGRSCTKKLRVVRAAHPVDSVDDVVSAKIAGHSVAELG